MIFCSVPFLFQDMAIPDENNDLEDDEIDGVLEGEFDELPEEFLRRHPMVQLLKQAQTDGKAKRAQLVDYLQTLN